MFWKDQNEEHKRLAGYCWSILKGINRINRSFEAERLKQSSDGKVLTHYLTGFQPKTLAKVGSLSRKLNCQKFSPISLKVWPAHFIANTQTILLDCFSSGKTTIDVADAIVAVAVDAVVVVVVGGGGSVRAWDNVNRIIFATKKER